MVNATIRYLNPLEFHRYSEVICKHKSKPDLRFTLWNEQLSKKNEKEKKESKKDSSALNLKELN